MRQEAPLILLIQLDAFPLKYPLKPSSLYNFFIQSKEFLYYTFLFLEAIIIFLLIVSYGYERVPDTMVTN